MGLFVKPSAASVIGVWSLLLLSSGGRVLSTPYGAVVMVLVLNILTFLRSLAKHEMGPRSLISVVIGIGFLFVFHVMCLSFLLVTAELEGLPHVSLGLSVAALPADSDGHVVCFVSSSLPTE